MKKYLIILLFSLFTFEFIAAQTKRLRRDDLSVTVHVSVVSLPGNYFRYYYVFENSSRSKQSMDALSIDLNDERVRYGGTVQNYVPPKGKNWGQFASYGEKLMISAEYDTTGKDVLELPPRSALLPGEKISFSLESMGLPSIGTFWAGGWAKWFFSKEQKDSLIADGYPESDLTATDNNFFKGITIVPKLQPRSFNSIDFLDTLYSYTYRTFTLGWLIVKKENEKKQSNEIVKGLMNYLDDTRVQLVKNKIEKAKEQLREFIEKVDEYYHENDKDYYKEKSRNSYLTKEAYILLKYNAEYLIGKLK